MNKPLHLLYIIFFFAIIHAAMVQADEKMAQPILDELIAAARADNPDLKAAKTRWQMYNHKIIPAGSLDDPSLSFAFSNYPVDSFAGDDYAMSGKIIRLSQNFPFPGKLAAREKIAEQQAKWYEALWQDSILQLTLQVKEAYFSLSYYDKTIQITEKNLQLLDDFIRLTESNYEIGRGLQQDVLKAQVERSRLTDKLYTLKQKHETSLANLNRLTNRPLSVQLVNLPDLDMPIIDVSLSDIQAASEEKRPMSAAYNALVDRFKAQKKLARLDYNPDFKIGFAYTSRESNRADDGTDFAGIEFTVNLPVFKAKRGEAVAEADAGVNMALEQYSDFRNTVHFNIHEAYSRYQQNRDQALLYESGILPQANQSFEAAMSGYQVGKINFLTLLDNLMMIYTYEIEFYRVLTEGQRSVARLEAESGMDILK